MYNIEAKCEELLREIERLEYRIELQLNNDTIGKKELVKVQLIGDQIARKTKLLEVLAGEA